MLDISLRRTSGHFHELPPIDITNPHPIAMAAQADARPLHVIWLVDESSSMGWSDSWFFGLFGEPRFSVAARYVQECTNELSGADYVSLVLFGESERWGGGYIL